MRFASWLALALLSSCRAAEPPLPPKPLRVSPRHVSNVAVLEAANAASLRADPGYDLSGAGVVVGDWDDGHARASHADLRGRVALRDGAGESEHATHTTATLAGSGAGDVTARGFAPAARVWAYDWSLDLAELEAAAPVLHLSSHPYGVTRGWARQPECPERPTWWGGPAREDAAFGKYGREAARLDALVHRTGLPTFWPAGNERLDRGVAAGEPHYHVGSCDALYRDDHLWEATLQYDTLGGHGVAKNVLTVGAARDLPGSAAGTRIVPLDLSAFGPTDDGRIKPELVLGGDSVRSASVAADDAYSAFDGTSSATAAAAGAGALLAELYRREQGADLRAEAMRALLVHAARDGGQARGPDYRVGYGLLDVRAAADLLAADAALAAGRRLVHGSLGGSAVELSTARDVPRGAALRVTLAWTDPPAPANRGDLDDATPALVNDLDLSLIAPDGTTRFWPWALDPSDPQAQATRARENRRDNLEVVEVDVRDNTFEGRWTVRLESAGALARGAPQRYALVSSVALEPPAHPVLHAPRQVELAFDAGQAPPPAELRIENRGAGSLTWSARALSTGLAVTPESGAQGEALRVSVDAAAYPEPGEYVARARIDSNDPSGPHELGVLVRVRCEPECEPGRCGADPRCGTLCARCADGEHCAGDRCEVNAPACPAGDIGSVLGSALVGVVLQTPGGTARSCDQPGDTGELDDGLGFTWRAPRAGRYLFSTRGSSADTVLSLRAGGCAGAELACNDDSGSAASALSARVEAGEALGVLLDARAAARGDRVQLDVRPARCPEVELGSRLGQGLVGASTFGGVDDGADACGGAGSEDAAFGWTAPADGVYLFSLFEPRYQAVLHVREGSCDGPSLGCSPAPDVGPVELPLAAGERVVVVVDGRDGASGDFQLDVQARDALCAGSCGAAVTGVGACRCDAACVAAGDCCIDACASCGHCRCARDCAGRACGDDGCGGSCGECDAGQRCDAGRCVSDPCAGVACEPCSECVAGRCQARPEGAPCEDGDLCSVLDRCVDGACIGQARDCDDGLSCTVDRCLPRSGACASEPSDACARCDGGSDCPLRLLDGGAMRHTDGGERDDAGAPSAAGGGGCGCRLRRSAAGGAAPGLGAGLLALWLLARRRLR